MLGLVLVLVLAVDGRGCFLGRPRPLFTGGSCRGCAWIVASVLVTSVFATSGFGFEDAVIVVLLVLMLMLLLVVLAVVVVVVVVTVASATMTVGVVGRCFEDDVQAGNFRPRIFSSSSGSKKRCMVRWSSTRSSLSWGPSLSVFGHW